MKINIKELNELIRNKDPKALDEVKKLSLEELQAREKNYEQRSCLEQACIYANLEVIKVLKEKGINLNEINLKENYGVLHYLVGASRFDTKLKEDTAAFAKRVEILHFFKQEEINFNMLEGNKRTAIHYLAFFPQELVLYFVPYLIKLGTDINRTDRDGKTFYDAMREQIVAKGSFTPVWEDFLKKQGACSSKELKEQESVSTVTELNIFQDASAENLLNPAYLRDIGTAVERIDTKNINKRDLETGKTAILEAVEEKNLTKFRLLYKSGANLFLRDHLGNSPIPVARKNKFIEKLLMDSEISSTLLKDFPYLQSTFNELEVRSQVTTSQFSSNITSFSPPKADSGVMGNIMKTLQNAINKNNMNMFDRFINRLDLENIIQLEQKVMETPEKENFLAKIKARKIELENFSDKEQSRFRM